MVPLRGAVLDFDGVLVQSMEVHAEAYRRILAPYGVRVEDAAVFRLEGARSETILRELLHEADVELAEPEIVRLGDAKQELFATLGPPQPYPGAQRLVERVRAAAPRLGVVTGTRKENVERLMPDLASMLDALLAQDAYTHDKPHPEPYRRAAQALGVPPERCVALENAVRGVESARAAGYAHVVAIATTMSVDELDATRADRVVGSHDEAARGLEAWLTSRTR